jgi:hypothetical protein
MAHDLVSNELSNKIRRLNVDQLVSDRERCIKLGSQERIAVHAQCNDRSPISSALPLGLSLYEATPTPQVDCNESRELLIWHLFDRSWLNHLASLCAMAKLTGRFVCLEPSAHDVAEGAMRGQAMPRVEAELLVNPYSAEIRIRILRLDSDPCNG